MARREAQCGDRADVGEDGVVSRSPKPVEGAASGLLVVSTVNPRYFAVASDERKAIYLTGSHIWNDFHDGMGAGSACSERRPQLDGLRPRESGRGVPRPPAERQARTVHGHAGVGDLLSGVVQHREPGDGPRGRNDRREPEAHDVQRAVGDLGTHRPVLEEGRTLIDDDPGASARSTECTHDRGAKADDFAGYEATPRR